MEVDQELMDMFKFLPRKRVGDLSIMSQSTKYRTWSQAIRWLYH
jgi:hypothetical protein